MAAAVPFIGLGLSAIGTGVSIAGQAAQRRQQREQYEKNLEIAKEDAKRIREQAAFKVELLEEKATEIRAKATAVHAARGLAGGRTYEAAKSKFERIVERDRAQILKRAEEQAERVVEVAEAGQPAGSAEAALEYTSTILTGGAQIIGGIYQYQQAQYPRGSIQIAGGGGSAATGAAAGAVGYGV